MSNEPANKWLVTTVDDNFGTTAVLVIVPKNDVTYRGTLRPLLRNGWGRPSRAEMARGAWSHAEGCHLDVVKNRVVHLEGRDGTPHIFIASGPTPMPLWRCAAHERRGLVVLVPPTTDLTAANVGDHLADLFAGDRIAHAALVTVRFDQYTGPFPKGYEPQ